MTIYEVVIMICASVVVVFAPAAIARRQWAAEDERDRREMAKYYAERMNAYMRQGDD